MAESLQRYRVSCDVGGTFTDFVLLDEITGNVVQDKVLTTPHDPSEGVLQGCENLLTQSPDMANNVKHLIHGTTLVINTLLQRNGARTGLITTRGYRDVLEMRRYMRPGMYDINSDPPPPYAPRNLRVEVDERILPEGEVERELDVESAREAIAQLRAQGVESIAVSLVHAYLNDVHEREIERLIREIDPALEVSISSQVLPQIGEYERTSSVVANAYVQPMARRYLEALRQKLGDIQFSDSLLLMLSSGGLTSIETAVQFPVRLVESGPVAGVLAAARLGQAAGISDVVSFDMGGTTAKAALIQRGELATTSDYEVARVHRFKKGTGIPLGIPGVDIIEVGTGGGSIARINEVGFVQVGPMSAGADPGPVCYGRGGSEPTVTDADLTLGYLDPDFFLGGKMQLDRDAAARAIEERIAGPLSMSVTQAAWGIVSVATEHMANAIKMHVAERGGDLSAAALVAFGGAGPVHAYGLLQKLRARQLIIPIGAGVVSALGMAMADISFDLVRTHYVKLSELDIDSFERGFAALEEEGREILQKADPAVDPQFLRSADMRYVGQRYELAVPLDAAAGETTLDSLAAAFARAYQERYGYVASDDAQIEVVNLRVRAVSANQPPAVTQVAPASADASLAAAIKATRDAYDPERGDLVPHTVYARERLQPGMAFSGPAIVEERESTAIIGSSGHVLVDEQGSLVITAA